MDFKKAYEEAMERAKELHEAGNALTKAQMEIVFPELKESEDERIREEIIGYLTHRAEVTGFTNEERDCRRWISYLERQKEQKPVGWKPQPESLEALMYAIEGKWEMIKPTSYLSRRLEDLYEGIVNTFNVNEVYLEELPKVASTGDIEELKALKRKIDASMDEKPAEWSEDDEAALGDLMWCIKQARESAKDENDMGNIWFAENWLNNRLKSLRPQPHWKPGEKQLNALQAFVGMIHPDARYDAVFSLLDELKAL